MKIQVINPNTTASMTQKIGMVARAVASPGTTIIATNPRMGPVSIEDHYDEAFSVVGILDEIRKGEIEGVDGYAIACFGDPGLLAAREMAKGPVIGIAEASMHIASFLSTGFSIVTTLGRTRIIAQHLVNNYGMDHLCRGIRSIDLPVLDLEMENSPARKLIVEECRRALEEDRSGAIILGCAGMADLAKDIANALSVPVIDGVSAAVKLVEILVSLNLGTSKVGDLAYPLSKPYTGLFESFSP